MSKEAVLGSEDKQVQYLGQCPQGPCASALASQLLGNEWVTGSLVSDNTKWPKSSQKSSSASLSLASLSLVIFS